MKIYAAIDTNVIVSAMLKENSLPWKVVDLVFDEKIVPLMNDEILKEYNEVLFSNKFDFDYNKVHNVLNSICDLAIFLDKTDTNELFVDDEDAKFYQIVLTARKDQDAFLVTGNIKHFPFKPFVVTPRQLLEMMHEI